MATPETDLWIRAVVMDFDGAICPNDVSEELLEAFGGPRWRDLDLEFQAGRVGSRETLSKQAALLHGETDSMIRYAVERFPLAPSFHPFVRWATGLGLTLAVASDGLGAHVAPMLAAAGTDGLAVHTNGFRMQDGAARLDFPNGHPVCVGCGTCKMRVVQRYRERFGPVAFVGEGHSDRYGALFADLTFARGTLAEICERDGIPFLPWRTFDDVRAGLERSREWEPPAGPIGPERCPGWTEP